MANNFVKILTFIFLFLIFDSFIVNAKTEEITVGLYEEYPYYYLDKSGNIQGYYHDIMNIIAEELDIEFKYERVNFNNYVQKLESGQIDLLFGVMKTKELEDTLEYTQYIVNNKGNYVFTSKDIEYGDFESLEGLTFGYIDSLFNHKYFYYLLESNGIEVEVKLAESDNQLKEWLRSGEIDFTISAGYDNFYKKYNEVYMYTLGPSFIVSSNSNLGLIDKVDKVLIDIYCEGGKSIYKIYNSYFNDPYKNIKLKMNIATIAIILVITIIVITRSTKYIKRSKKLAKYLSYIDSNKFKLYYQPIVDMTNKRIIGYEALLRLDNGERILTPYHFLKDMEKLDVMYDITLWIIKKALFDYNKLKNMRSEGSNFYISINISYKDLINPNFINDVQKILKNYSKNEYSLCFEVTERVSNNDFESINKSVSSLKAMGIMFAMDDFGVKYSNFDILQKVDYDIVKLDKIFIDRDKSTIKNQKILKSILDILYIYDKRVVIEGVETLEQIQLIKKLGREKTYVQGYYYSRPCAIEDL